MNRLRKLAFMSLTVGVAIGLGACGDDPTPPPVDGLQDFPGEAITSDLDANMRAFEASSEANSFLSSALIALGDHGVVFEPATGGSAALFESRQVGDLRTVPLVESYVTFPSDALGETFVYNATSGEWEIDESRTGAPANGIRVMWYATDGLGTPLPEVVNGYFDLTDEDGDGFSRLGVEIVSTSSGTLTLADYTIGFASTEASPEVTEQFIAEGFVQGAERQVAFHIEGDSGADSNTGNQSASFEMSFQSAGSAYDFTLTQTFAGDTGVYEEGLMVAFTREDVTTELELNFAGTESASDGSGTLMHDGELIANIIAEGEGEFAYTTPDGDPFSQADQAKLDRVVGALFVSGFLLLLSIPLLVPIV